MHIHQWNVEVVPTHTHILIRILSTRNFSLTCVCVCVIETRSTPAPSSRRVRGRLWNMCVLGATHELELFRYTPHNWRAEHFEAGRKKAGGSRAAARLNVAWSTRTLRHLSCLHFVDDAGIIAAIFRMRDSEYYIY